MQERQRKRMLSDVTNKIQNQGGLKVNPETGVRYEEPLEEKHPAMDVALAVSQPGTIVEKALAPIVYKGMAKSISEGNLSEALMSGIAPVKFGKLSSIFNKKQNIDWIPEAEKISVNALLSGTKPAYLVPTQGYGSNGTEKLVTELSKQFERVDIPRVLKDGSSQTVSYFINPNRLKETIKAYQPLYADRLGLAGTNTAKSVDKLYDYMKTNPTVLDPSVVTTSGKHDLIGITLGYGPKDAILFDLRNSANPIKTMQLRGYDKTIPGWFNILSKHIKNGTLEQTHSIINGNHVGFRYVPKVKKSGGRLKWK